MDLGIYTSKSAYAKKSRVPLRERNCLNCGNAIPEDSAFLGKGQFCCEECKEQYLSGPRNR